MNNADTDNQYVPKVGRHRVFSNDQRKDRNRRAQAAFRDRRSKHTHALETTIVNFEETIKNLKETSHQSLKRAEAAEERSHHLAFEVVALQRLLEVALADNQRFQAHMVTVASGKMSPSNPINYIFDDVFNHPTSCSPISLAAPDVPLALFNSLDNNSMLTVDESPENFPF